MWGFGSDPTADRPHNSAITVCYELTEEVGTDLAKSQGNAVHPSRPFGDNTMTSYSGKNIKQSLKQGLFLFGVMAIAMGPGDNNDCGGGDEPDGTCEEVSDCEGLEPNIDCVGDWTCGAEGQCLFQCGSDPCADVLCEEGNQCIDGQCMPVIDPCATVDCAPGFTCSNGECQPDAQQCMGDGECGPGMHCSTSDGDCFGFDPGDCTGDEPCGVPAVCMGQCVPNTSECDNDAQCGAGEYCSFDNCFPGPGGFHDGDAPAAELYCPGVCEPVEEPTCDSDNECGPGQFCNFQAGPCWGSPTEPTDPDGNDAAFPADEYCPGICEDLPGGCSSDADCGEDQYCGCAGFANGLIACEPQCLPKNEGCIFDTECPGGHICEGGECLLVAQPCSYDGQCGDNEYCEFTECFGAAEPDCDPDQHPNCMIPPECTGFCAPNVQPNHCTSNADCGGDYVCEIQECWAEPMCDSEHGDCAIPNPEPCYGQCVPPTTSCWQDSDCGSHQVCQPSDCTMPTFPCEPGSDDCNGNDVGCPGVCVVAPPSGCTSDDQCGDGQHCLQPDCAVPFYCDADDADCIMPACEGICVDNEPGVCHYDGQLYPPGASFPADDGCNTCFCSDDGFVGCTEMACPPNGECNTNSDCGPNQECVATPCYCNPNDADCDLDSCPNFCVDVPGGGCGDDDSICADGYHCEETCFEACPGCMPGAPCPPCTQTCESQCVPDAPEPTECVVTGCSAHICAPEPMASTCEWADYYQCYQLAECGSDAAGQCGWQPNAAFVACMEQYGGPF